MEEAEKIEISIAKEALSKLYDHKFECCPLFFSFNHFYTVINFVLTSFVVQIINESWETIFDGFL